MYIVPRKSFSFLPFPIISPMAHGISGLALHIKCHCPYLSQLNTILFPWVNDVINGAAVPNQLLDPSSHISIEVQALSVASRKGLSLWYGTDNLAVQWLQFFRIIQSSAGWLLFLAWNFFLFPSNYPIGPEKTTTKKLIGNIINSLLWF